MSEPLGKVVIVDDDELLRSMLGRSLRRDGYRVTELGSAKGVVEQVSAASPDVLLLDVGLPDGSGIELLSQLRERGVETQVVMITGDATAGTATQAMKLGAADYLTKPFDLDEVRVLLRNLTEMQRLKREVRLLRSEEERAAGRDIVGNSPPMRELGEKIGRIAEAGVNTVLLLGESGTGKELVARHIHRALHPPDEGRYEPFIAVNCTALPENLIESELFGHEKGAFTGARADKQGLFEQAEGGSLLLDEIGDMPQPLQAKLLRVLEERTVRRVGGHQEIPVRLTVLASTNRDLAAAVQEGDFRKDLYYRLQTFALTVPPLRERGEDVLLLARFFLHHFSAKYKKKPVPRLTSAAEQKLLAYRWPGNVRELRNAVERMVVMESVQEIDIRHLPPEISEGGSVAGESSGGRLVLPEEGLSLEEVKRDLILQALERAGNNRAKAAKLLGVSYDTLRYQLKRFGLD